jgi:hypothetical protein
MKRLSVVMQSHMFLSCCLIILLLFGAVRPVPAQQAEAVNGTPVVPPLVNFSGVLTDVSGKPLGGMVGVTFLLYKDAQGGAPLWLETQNVNPDKSGHYTAMLGSTSSHGLPPEIFVAGEAHWLGVQVSGQAEQPRVLLVSAPYALKAGDAETLGGFPASAFMLAPPGTKSGIGYAPKATVPGRALSSSAASTSAASTTGSVGGAGATNFLPVWTSATNLGNSLVYQAGTRIGINTTTPGATLSVRGNGAFFADSNTEALQVTQAGGTGSGIVASTNSTSGIGVSGTSSSTTSSVIGGIGVFGFSSNPSGSGVEGTSGNIGVIGNGGTIGGLTGMGVQGNGSQYGVYGSVNSSLFPAKQAGVFGTTASSSGTAYGVEGVASATTGNPAGVYGASSSTGGYGVEGVSGNVGVYGTSANVGVFGQGNSAGIEGIASGSGGYSGFFDGGPLFVGGNVTNLLAGDAGCGAGYAGLGFTTGFLSGCTNYALLGGPNGGTYVNASGTAAIHFRSNNNELATIDNSGNVAVIGQNGGGNLTVAGKVSSSNVIAQASASNFVGASNCLGTLKSPNANCLVPNLKLTKATSNPAVLVMVSINGITTDQCALANFYLVVDSKIVALSTVSYNTNNSPIGNEQGSLTIMSLQNLAAGSHTFQVQAATDFSSNGCNTFTGATGVSAGDGGMGSLRSLIVREF